MADERTRSSLTEVADMLDDADSNPGDPIVGTFVDAARWKMDEESEPRPTDDQPRHEDDAKA